MNAGRDYREVMTQVPIGHVENFYRNWEDERANTIAREHPEWTKDQVETQAAEDAEAVFIEGTPESQLPNYLGLPPPVTR